MTLRALASASDLAALLKRDFRKNLMFIAYRIPDSQRVRKFRIPKKSGGEREICAPTGALIRLQQQILPIIEADYTPKRYSHGFNKNRSICTNADVHINKRWVLNIDLKDFFDNITFARIFGRLKAGPYSYQPDVARIIAHIACHDRKLMQGGALSPILSNMVCDRLDSELARLCHPLGCRYSRYADDITISTNRIKFPSEIASIDGRHNSILLGEKLLKLIENNGFFVNDSKTRMQAKHVRQEVTGLVVNEKRNVPRDFVRNIRGMLHAWEKYGLQEASREHFAVHRQSKGRLPNHEAKSFEWVVRGKIEFVRQVRGSTDFLFQKLASRFNAVAESRFPLVPIASVDILRESVWIIEGKKRRRLERKIQRKIGIFDKIRIFFGMQIPDHDVQVEFVDDEYIGTAFFLSGVGIVTCRHCFEPGCQIYRPDKDNLKFNVRIIFDDPENDICIVEALDYIPPTWLPRARLTRAADADVTSLNIGDEVQFAGFPSNVTENHISIKSGKISRFLNLKQSRSTSTVLARQIVIDGTILEGTSGGPALRDGKVVGIAARGPGRQSNLEASVIVPITTLPKAST